MMPYTQSRHPVQEAANQPPKLWTFTIVACRYCVLFFVGLIPFLVNSRMICFTKNLYLLLICPKYVFQKDFWLTHIHFGKLQSSSFMSLCQQWGPPSSYWCTLSLQDSLNLFGTWLRLLIHHLDYSALQPFINISLPSTSREISFSTMGCKLLDYVAHRGQRNIKISGDGLVTLRLLIFFHNFGSQSSDSSLSLPFLSVLHA